MKYMLLLFMPDGGTVLVHFARRNRFRPPFRANAHRVRLYRRVREHTWTIVTEWGHMCADDGWDVMYHEERKHGKY